MKRYRTALLLLGILVLAAVLRLWKIAGDLPYINHPDEPVSLNVAMQIFRSGDLNPHFFDYPSLYFYLIALAYVPFYLYGLASGALQSRMDLAPVILQGMGTTYAPMQALVISARLATVLFSLGCLLLVYFIGSRLTAKRRVGLLAALLLAVSTTHSELGRYVTPDTYATFFVLGSFAGTVLLFQSGKWRYHLLAGAMAGLAASCKYNAGLIVLPIVAAHLFRYGLRGFLNPRLYVAAAASALAFLLTTPYALLDYRAFAAGMTSTARHYAQGHAGMEGSSLQWYLQYLWQSNTLVPILALAEMIRGALRREKATLLLAVFPVTYFALISQFLVRNDRTILLLIPFLALLAALLLDALWEWANRGLAGEQRRTLRFSLGISLVLLASFTAGLTFRRIDLVTNVAAKNAAREWIIGNVPAGAHLMIESYAPFLPPDRYTVTWSGSMTDHTPGWYRENGAQYLVFSAGIFGRYYADPVRYREVVEKYESLFHDFPPIRTFDQGGPEIRVSRIPIGPQ